MNGPRYRQFATTVASRSLCTNSNHGLDADKLLGTKFGRRSDLGGWERWLELRKGLFEGVHTHDSLKFPGHGFSGSIQIEVIR